MAPLTPELRRDLDKAISSPGTGARGLAESAARATLARLGVADAEASAGLTGELRGLRTALRERATALGGGIRTAGIPLLVEEIAYEQWHRMLFARFLAENDLLLHPEGAPVPIAVVRELATEEGERDPWVLAARYAAAMLPGIFRADDPANRVAFAPEDRSRLEAVLERLPATVFTADDALGWVYQFWQSERKDEVNKRGDKIGGADLPPVTQLFTEHYMVRFLLENSLGAWWAGRHPDSPLLREWEYLRYRDDGTPAAGTFEGWPTLASEVTVMDPCCGSGHFLTAAADMLRRMRSEEEGLTPAHAAVAVLRDNLFGLELDARCLQLAAFNLALDAWKAGGYQPLPIPNLACTGIAIKGQRTDWQRLAGDDESMRAALDRLYDLFQDAPELGSLIDPRSAAATGTVWEVDVDQLLTRLDRALAKEKTADPAAAVFGEAAKGTAKAAQLLAGRYWLVATNPPYLTRGKQSLALQSFADSRFLDGRGDLATMFHLRSLMFTASRGTSLAVSPESWLQLRAFADFRKRLLTSLAIRYVCPLGMGAFSGSGGFSVVLSAVECNAPRNGDMMMWLDASEAKGSELKALTLRKAELGLLRQSDLLSQPDSRITGASASHSPLLDLVAESAHGQGTFDSNRFAAFFWEIDDFRSVWVRRQSTVPAVIDYGGCTGITRWENGEGSLADFMEDWRKAGYSSGKWRAGVSMWGRRGVLVSQMGQLPATLYAGHAFDENAAVVAPFDDANLPALWSYLSNPAYTTEVRRIDRSLKVTPGTLTQVPFDLEHWQAVAAEQYPNGLPEPHSDDPTQWLFKGNMGGSEAPLQIAVARLLGYRWPEQEHDGLDELVDGDGLVPLVSAGGEPPAAERLRTLLGRAYGDTWSPQLLERLLAEAGSPRATLETWLRDEFFSQHTKLFHQRPFIWHVWDGRKDGFSVLCHYHRLDRAKVERLTYTLLGDWIERQRAARDEPGAEARLNAALGLQDKLKLILVGEAPYDIYVRWKTLAEQPIGWEPDLDDGVRLNIRPFWTADVLRSKVNVKWDKDRGKNPDGSERINDLHPTLAEKRAARAARGDG